MKLISLIVLLISFNLMANESINSQTSDISTMSAKKDFSRPYFVRLGYTNLDLMEDDFYNAEGGIHLEGGKEFMLNDRFSTSSILSLARVNENKRFNVSSNNERSDLIGIEQTININKMSKKGEIRAQAFMGLGLKHRRYHHEASFISELMDDNVEVKYQEKSNWATASIGGALMIVDRYEVIGKYTYARDMKHFSDSLSQYEQFFLGAGVRF